MTSVNTNMSALVANKNLTEQADKLDQAMTRLSSGLRINSAADDVSGSSIASRMDAQIKSLTMAIRNGHDAVSMTQTAEGALGEIENILQRIRELAVQAVNDTNGTADREYLQAEVTSLLAEIDRVSTQTVYNNMNLLDGTQSGVIQVGTEAGQSVSYSIDSILSLIHI